MMNYNKYRKYSAPNCGRKEGDGYTLHKAPENKEKKEWETVYDLVFSKDVVEIEKGYEKLRAWKARCQRLPAGIECTLIILEAIIFERKVNEDVLNNFSVMKSVYAMAITRFLNHATSFEKDKTSASLYKIAQRLNIPEWMVNLRHEASHGSDLPSLEVLRAGVVLALEWLHIAYWAKYLPEEKVALIIPSDSKAQELKTKIIILMKVYQELYSLKMEGLHLIKDIKNPKLLEDMGSIIRYDFCTYEDLYGKNCLKNEIMPTTINEFINIIITKFLNMLNSAQNNSIDLNVPMDYFLEVSNFLLSTEETEDLVSEKEPDQDRLSISMRQMWEKLLCDAIQKSGALPFLLKKLVNFSNFNAFHQKMAAYWIKEISLGLKKAILIRKEFIFQKKKNKGFNRWCQAKDLIPFTEQLEIRKKLQSQCHEYHRLLDTIDLSPNHLPDITQLIEDAIRHPNKNSTIYMNELLDLYKTPLSEEKKEKILHVMNIYLKDYVSEDYSDVTQYYEVTDVHSQIKKNISTETGEEHLKEKLSEYTNSGGSHNWENVPIGMLPWQENTDTMLTDEDVVYILPSKE